jgi:23S rRNA (cytosine1962-C5)-methyltransferase
MLPCLRLKKNEDRRIKSGHLWIYSNEIDIHRSPLKNFTAGELVIVENQIGKKLGLAYINPHTLICARMLSNLIITIDESFFIERLQKALHLRESLYSAPYYRLSFGEGDGLPGLVIDRFNDILVIQITTAGMEKNINFIKNALEKLLAPKAILLRNDSSMRSLENLPLNIEPLLGEPPKEISLIENNTHFIAPIWEGQKTGWFYDHRDNRAWLQKYAKDKKILDVFSYLGAWGIQMAQAGADSITCIDSSAFALEYVKRNAELNNISEKVSVIKDDAFDALKNLHEAKEKFDIVIIDPPAFIKNKKHFQEGFQAYLRLNSLAMKLIKPQGWIVSASCSMHLTLENLNDILRRASLNEKKNLQIIHHGHQASDHPIHPAIPEMNYLKALVGNLN